MHAQKGRKGGKVAGSRIVKTVSFITAGVFASRIGAATFLHAFNRGERLFRKGTGQVMAQPERKQSIKLPEKTAKSTVLKEDARVLKADSANILVETDTLENPCTGHRYIEEMYVSKQGLTIIYDPSADTIIASETPAAYRIEFVHDEYGIPVAHDGDTCQWGKTENHRVKMKVFSAQEGIPDAVRDNNMDLGNSLVYEGIKVRLVDISVAVGPANVHPAIVDIIDAATDSLVSQEQIDPGKTLTVTVGGEEYTIRCYRTHPGFTLAEKWADIAVYDSAYIDRTWAISRLDPEGWGEIKLGQEGAFDILSVGDTLRNELYYCDIKIKLLHVQGPPGTTGAIVNIIDVATGVVISQDLIKPGGTLGKTIAGKEYLIHCYQAAFASAPENRWAVMEIYSSEITLENGERFDDENNRDWEVGLAWTKKCCGPTPADSTSCLKRITLSNKKVGVEEVIPSGEGMGVFPSPARGSISFGYQGKIDPSAKLDIYNAAGRRVKTAEFDGSQEITVDVSDMAAGVYFAMFAVEGKKKSAKFTVAR